MWLLLRSCPSFSRLLAVSLALIGTDDAPSIDSCCESVTAQVELIWKVLVRTPGNAEMSWLS